MHQILVLHNNVGVIFLVLNKYVDNEALWVNNKDGCQVLLIAEVILLGITSI